MSHFPTTPHPLQRPLTVLHGIGPKMAEKWSNLGIHTLADALFHLPLRYEDRRHITPISALQRDLKTHILGEIQQVSLQSRGSRRQMLVQVQDDNGGRLTLRFMHFNRGMQQAFEQAKQVQAFGKVQAGQHRFEMIHPEYWLDAPLHLSEHFTPIYPTVEGLSQASWLKLMQQIVPLLTQHPMVDYLPEHIQQQHGSLTQALRFLHQPTEIDERLLAWKHPAQLRLILEELTAHQLRFLQWRTQQQQHTSFPWHPCPTVSEQFLAQLPFQPTAAQQRVMQEISTDLHQPYPMLRLLQGDVGSGKTLVAALTALQAISQGYQVALMAPTEILAEQHYLNFQQWFEPLGIHIAFLTGKQKVSQRREQLNRIVQGEAKLVVGTHALFQDQVVFQQLALIIIDEQHRFGVQQRLALRNKGLGAQPHQLMMTATPIPRTLTMTAYANLAVSIIDELPPGRSPIETRVIASSHKTNIIERLHQACLHEGKQAYWVCTLVEESEHLQAQAAEVLYQELTAALPDLAIGLIHGRMNATDKQQVMRDFSEHRLSLLIATTVIEVGVNVPNASIMIIENPERLGLAQLHQLRGRVGRGSIASYCMLLYETPLSHVAQQRLNIMRESQDGFYIAEQDLQIRGPGEILGTRQSGLVQYRMADLLRDQAYLPQAQKMAEYIVQQQPQSIEPLLQRWISQQEDMSQS